MDHVPGQLRNQTINWNMSLMTVDLGSGHTPSPTRNKSKEQIDNANFHFYATGIVGSVFVVLGIVGNLLSVSVLSSKRMRRGSASVCRILVALALYDTVFLFSYGLSGIMPYLVYRAGRNMGTAENIIFYIFYPILHIARTGSVYTTVIVTIERCIAVIKPLKAAIIFTRTRTNKILITIFIFSIIFNIPRCMENALYRESNIIKLSKSAFHDTVFCHTVYLIYINFLFHFGIPFTLIALFNGAMVYTLRRVTRQFNKDKCNGSSQLNAKSGHRPSCETGHKLFAIVLAVTSMFFLCHLVPAVALVMEQTENADIFGECSSACSRISSLGDTLIVVCSATNFILYCLFGRKFRMVFQSSFCPCLPGTIEKRRSTKKSTVHSTKSVTIVESNA